MCVHSVSHVGEARLLTRPLFITTSWLCQSTSLLSRGVDPTLFQYWNADPAFKQNWVNVSCLLGWSTMLHYWQNTTRSVLYVLCQCWVNVMALGYITENHYILPGSTVTTCLYASLHSICSQIWLLQLNINSVTTVTSTQTFKLRPYLDTYIFLHNCTQFHFLFVFSFYLIHIVVSTFHSRCRQHSYSLFIWDC